MALPGVSFDPAQNQQYNGASGPNVTNAPRGVQEAIKILSMRLPRVLGASAISPHALLASPGGSALGEARGDAVANRVLARYFPNAQTGAPPAAPFAPSFGQTRTIGQPQPGESWTMPPSPPVRFSGQPRRESPTGDFAPPRYAPPPRVMFDNPIGQGDLMVGPDGRPIGGFLPGNLAPPPFPPAFWSQPQLPVFEPPSDPYPSI